MHEIIPLMYLKRKDTKSYIRTYTCAHTHVHTHV